MSIKSEIVRIAEAKEQLRLAINEKGGTLTGELLDAYAGAVRSLPETGADLSAVTAGAEDILLGKVSVNSEGEIITGTIADAVIVNDGSEVTVSAGYNRTEQKFTVTEGSDISYGYLDENGSFQPLLLSGDEPVSGGAAEAVSGLGLYLTGLAEPEYSDSANVQFGYITADGLVQKIDLSGEVPAAADEPEAMEIFMIKSGVDEPDYGKSE